MHNNSIIIQICTFLEIVILLHQGKDFKVLDFICAWLEAVILHQGNSLQCACFGHFFLSLWLDGSTNAKQHLLAKCPGTNGPMGIMGGKQ